MKCALCRTGTAGVSSHIIPAFVFRWIRKTSPTGFFRDPANPNRRFQDGTRCALLCSECEERFSKLEALFARKVFTKTNLKTDFESFDYSEYFHRFCVSVAWRSPWFIHHSAGERDRSDYHSARIAEALERWRQYLLEQAVDVGAFMLHFFVFDTPADVKNIDTPENLRWYFERGAEFNTVASECECYIFCKLCKIVIVGCIEEPNPQQWVGTKVALSQGRYEVDDKRVSGCFFNFSNASLREIERGRARISQKQADKMMGSFKKRFPDAC